MYKQQQKEICSGEKFRHFFHKRYRASAWDAKFAAPTAVLSTGNTLKFKLDNVIYFVVLLLKTI